MVTVTLRRTPSISTTAVAVTRHGTSGPADLSQPRRALRDGFQSASIQFLALDPCPRHETRPTVRLTHFRYGTRTQRMGASPMIGHMEWTFTGEVIEWRGPAPYLFVAMTPEESKDLKEAARALSTGARCRSTSPSATPSSPLRCSLRTGATWCPSRWRCSERRKSRRARSLRSSCVSTPRAENDGARRQRQKRTFRPGAVINKHTAWPPARPKTGLPRGRQREGS
jgi:hypothetical protein